MIIDRYLIREIIKPFLVVGTILVLIVAGFSSSTYLKDAASGLLPGDVVAYMIGLKTLIGLEVLLPTALYLGAVIGLARLHTDAEMAALHAAGVSERQVLKSVFRLAIVVAVLVGILSMYVRPWAYRMGYLLEARALAGLDLSKLESGRFYKLQQTNHVIFAEHIDREHERLEEVFFRTGSSDETTTVTYAREAYLPKLGEGEVPAMTFIDGYSYELDKSGQRDISLKFGELRVLIDTPTGGDIGYKRKAEPTARLAESTHKGDLAELQWRQSMPLITVLLGLLAVPMSRTPPRQGRFARLFTAVLLFAIYYNLASLARTWVDQGKVGAVPGMWWVHVFPAAVLILFEWWPVRALRRRRT